MKKMISLLLVLVLALSMTACSSGPDILGTYEATFDMTDLIVSEFDSGAGVTGTDLSLGNYLDEFTVKVIFEFNEDGSYTQRLDASIMDESLAAMRDAVIPMMDDFMLKSFSDQLAPYGYNISTREDVEAAVGMAWDDIFPQVLGISLEEFIQTLIDQLKEEVFAETIIQEGMYKAEKGKLYLSYTAGEEPMESAYETYEIDGDTVNITGGVNVEENEYVTYPYILTKIS